MRRLARILRGDEAAEIAEAAMVLPLVFMFLLGSVWFGRAFNIYSTITQAAQQGAVTAARPSCATCLPGTGWSGNASFPSDTVVDNVIFSVMQASSIDPSQIIAPPSVSYPSCSDSGPAPPGACTTTNNITVCRSVVLNATTNPPQCGTIVSFQYPFKFYFPFTSLSMQPITLSAQAQSRMEN
ncbi:MAG: TadE family protein [Terriglobales bacterium]